MYFQLFMLIHINVSKSEHYKKTAKKLVTKWSLERYSDHPVTTMCSLRKSRHKDKSVTKWSQSATTRTVVTDNDHNNVVTDNDHICGHK